jgi:hypothetical protein
VAKGGIDGLKIQNKTWRVQTQLSEIKRRLYKQLFARQLDLYLSEQNTSPTGFEVPEVCFLARWIKRSHF